MHIQWAEIASVLVFFIGFYGLITNKNIIKSIASIGLMELSAVTFFISLGFLEGMKPPIGQDLEMAVDPLPQALVITAIIIGVAVTAITLTMLMSLYRQSRSMDWDIVKNQNTE